MLTLKCLNLPENFASYGTKAFTFDCLISVVCFIEVYLCRTGTWYVFVLCVNQSYIHIEHGVDAHGPPVGGYQPSSINQPQSETLVSHLSVVAEESAVQAFKR